MVVCSYIPIYVALYCLTFLPRDLKLGVHIQFYTGSNLGNVNTPGEECGGFRTKQKNSNLKLNEFCDLATKTGQNYTKCYLFNLKLTLAEF